jgi:hypothetical protein
MDFFRKIFENIFLYFQPGMQQFLLVLVLFFPVYYQHGDDKTNQ